MKEAAEYWYNMLPKDKLKYQGPIQDLSKKKVQRTIKKGSHKASETLSNAPDYS